MLDPIEFIDLDAKYEKEAAMIVAEEMELALTKAIATAIKHVRKFFLTRKSPPSKAEEIGEFVNGLRRELHATNELFLTFGKITDVSMWSDIAKPSSFYTYKWDFAYSSKGGSYKMNHATISHICYGATIMAQDKNIDEEFLEINKSLNDLLREQSVLDVFVRNAQDLNTKAGIVVDSLCSIAEKLES